MTSASTPVWVESSNKQQEPKYKKKIQSSQHGPNLITFLYLTLSSQSPSPFPFLPSPCPIRRLLIARNRGHFEPVNNRQRCITLRFRRTLSI